MKNGTIDLAWSDRSRVHVSWDDDGRREIAGNGERVKWLKRFLRRPQDVYFPSAGVTVRGCLADTWEWTIGACDIARAASGFDFEVEAQCPDGYQTARDKLLADPEFRAEIEEAGGDPDDLVV